MKTFLNIFGVEERNGLSQFSVDIDSTYDLINNTEYFFFPPKIDLRDNPKNDNSTNTSDHFDSEEDTDANQTCDIISFFVNNIQSLGSDKDNYHESIDSADEYENNDSFNIGIEKCFDE